MTWRIVLLVVLMTAVLAGVVGMRVYTLATGKEILLQTVPVDPRSLFQGDYVVLDYPISTIDLSRVAGEDRNFRQGEQIYVELGPDGAFWSVVRVHKALPTELREDHVAMRGTVDSLRAGSPMPFGGRFPGRAEIRYGIEQFFVPQGQGIDLERYRNLRRLAVIVAVDQYGTSGIKGLVIDGEVICDDSQFWLPNRTDCWENAPDR